MNQATVNELHINESKAKVLLVAGKHLPSEMEHTPSVSVNERELNSVSNSTLLGLETDEKFTFDAHVDKLCKKLSQRMAVLRKIGSFLPLEQRQLFFDATVRPVMDYANVILQIVVRIS